MGVEYGNRSFRDMFDVFEDTLKGSESGVGNVAPFVRASKLSVVPSLGGNSSGKNTLDGGLGLKGASFDQERVGRRATQRRGWANIPPVLCINTGSTS